MIAELPVGVADPLERLAAMRAQMDTTQGIRAGRRRPGCSRRSPTDSAVAAGAGAAGTRPSEAHVPQRTIDTVTTNVRGPQHPLYAVGRRMVAYLPFVPIGQGVRIGVAILSYNGGVSFGVTGDYDTIPDVEGLCRSIEAGIDSLLSRARRPAGAGRTRRPHEAGDR